MGARACMTGRPYLYGLAAHGAPGVARVLELLRMELERTLALLGCANVDELTRDHIRLAGEVPDFLQRVPSPCARALTRTVWWIDEAVQCACVTASPQNNRIGGRPVNSLTRRGEVRGEERRGEKKV